MWVWGNAQLKVSVIICTYSKENVQNTIEAVDSVLNQTYSDLEVIVVVDGNEELLKILKNTLPVGVRVVFNEKTGLANARNTGYKYAGGAIIAYLDDDAVADTNWISRLVMNYSDHNVICVGGRIYPLWESGRPLWFPEELDWIIGCHYKGHPEERCEVRNVIGCNMSFRRDVFEKVGFFQPELDGLGKKPVAGDEMEFCLRALNKIPNSLIMYDPRGFVGHKTRKTRPRPRYMLTRAYYEGISKAHISSLHRNQKNSLSVEKRYFAEIFLDSIPNYLRAILTGKNIIQNIAKLNMLIACITLVFAGYLCGKLLYRI